MALTIYGIARSRALRTLWMAKELGVAYRHEETDFSDAGVGSAAFKRINPMGQIPAIEDDGLVLSESLAINLYLARKYGGPLAPKDVTEEGRAFMWTLFAATQLEGPGVDILYNRLFKPEAERDEAVAKRGIEAAQRPLGVLDQALNAGGGTLMGGRFTVADVNVACALFYYRVAPEALAAHGAVRTFWEAVKARPAFQAAMALRGE
jgi:glutathione S-transferase